MASDLTPAAPQDEAGLIERLIERLRRQRQVYNGRGTFRCEPINPDGKEAATALERLSTPDWRSMDSAPRDGEPILIWKPDERMVGEYMMSAYWCDTQGGFVPVGGVHKQGYYSTVVERDQGYPTHWMPLPAAPSPLTGETR